MSFLNPFHGWNKVILVNIVESSLRETGYPCVLTHDQTLQDTTATKRIAADKTKFPLGIDPVKDCDSHVKASPQTQTLETTNIVPTTNFLNVTFSLTDGTTLEKLIQAAVTWWDLMIIEIVVFINLKGVSILKLQRFWWPMSQHFHQDQHGHCDLINDDVLFEYQ